MDQQIQDNKTVREKIGDIQKMALLNILEDMKKEQQEMEKQKVATLNILEDISEAQRELKGRYIESEALKSLVQKLGSSLEMRTIMNHIADAIRQFFPDSVVAYAVLPFGKESFSNNIYIRASFDIDDKYMLLIKDKIAKYTTTMTKLFDLGNKIDNWTQGSFNFNFIEGKKDEKSELLPLSHLSIPMVIPDFVAGVFDVSLGIKGGFGKQEIYFINTIIDNAISTINRLKLLIDSEHSRLDDLLKSMTNGVLMFDINKRLLVANPALKSIIRSRKDSLTLDDFFIAFKEKNETVSGKIDSDKIREDRREVDLSTAINKVLMTGDTIHFGEAAFFDKTFEVFITAVSDHKHQVAGGAIILHDITHIKEVDRMKTEFVSVASHQLRTPLTGINWYIEMLLSGDVGEISPKQREYLEEVYDGSQRMVRLVNELLNVSRLETGRLKIEPQLVQMEDFVQDIINETRPLALAKKCSCVFKKPDVKLPEIPIDKSLMGQVVHNLITNALKYSAPDRCSVIVKLEQKVLPGKKEESVVVSVQDSGIGIPEDMQKRIFEKFFRADNAVRLATEGSGLGLYIARMIMEASGGEIWFESKHNEGTTFYIAIPMKGMTRKEGDKGLS